MPRTNPAKIDQNDIMVGMGVSSTDNVTPTMFHVDPVTSYLLTTMSTDVLSPTVATRCKIDENDQKTKYGISSVDGVTLVPIRTDSNGVLLCQIN